MNSYSKKINLETKKQFELLDITQEVRSVVLDSGISSGICLVFCGHTTAAIRLNHNEPLLIQDIMKTFYHLVPLDQSFGHDLFELRQNVAANERSNGHAHVKSFIMGSSESLIIDNSELILGAKQSIFFVEFDGGRKREILIKIIGEK